ncbi:MAG: hypothetical protein OXD36_01230, partial [Rhodobacter sp.]|nr:hypothetical protein [Rhodobacter sp.]
MAEFRDEAINLLMVFLPLVGRKAEHVAIVVAQLGVVSGTLYPVYRRFVHQAATPCRTAAALRRCQRIATVAGNSA